MSEPQAVAALTLLRRRGQTLATAESLTGGLIGQLLTAVPGASAAYLGGAITYATRLKTSLAGVEEATLTEHGPVAARTAVEMAAGIADRCFADWGLAVTGVAGPEPQDGHPVGQVFLALCRRDPRQSHLRELRLTGDRGAIRGATAQAALDLVVEVIGMAGDRASVVGPRSP